MSLPISLTDYALETMRENILTGTYPPGSKLLTEAIAKELGVSRTPVIAAINRLVVEELAVNIPRHGTVVRKFTRKEVKDILEARYMIERFAAPLVVEHLEENTDQLERLEVLLEKFDHITDMSYADANKLDSEFHGLFVEMSGNSQLVKLYKLNWSIGITYHIFYLAHLPLETQRTDYQCHKNLVEAVKKKDLKALLDVIAGNQASNMRLIEERLPQDA